MTAPWINHGGVGVSMRKNCGIKFTGSAGIVPIIPRNDPPS